MKNPDLELSNDDLDCTHRIGKPRLIIVKSFRYGVRRKSIYKQKKLKNSWFTFTESLTVRKMEGQCKAREEFRF